MPTTLRASVTADAAGLNPGDSAPVLVDGSDTPITANGLQFYQPTPGDRLLVQQVGGQVEILQFISQGTVPYVSAAALAAVSATANSALSTATTASSDASSALSTASTANTNASSALSTASTANTNASTALSAAGTAQTAANNAQTTANAKITVFRQSTTPTALAAGDVWYDTGNDNRMSVASAPGSASWVLTTYGSGALGTNILGGKVTPISQITQLAWGVPNPSAALSTTPTQTSPEPWKGTTWETTNTCRKGGVLDGTNYTYVRADTTNVTPRPGVVCTYNPSTGAETVVSGALATDTTNFEQILGVTKVGTSYYVLTKKNTSQCLIYTYNSSWAKTATTTLTPTYSAGLPALGTDGTNLLVSYIDATWHVVVQVYAPGATSPTSTVTSTTTVGAAGISVWEGLSILSGSFDLGAARYILIYTGTDSGFHTGDHMVSMTTAGVIQTAEGFDNNAVISADNPPTGSVSRSLAMRGVIWDTASSRFVVLMDDPYAPVGTSPPYAHAWGWYRLSTQKTSVTRWLAYTWADVNVSGTGTHVTALSPATSTSVTLPARLAVGWTAYTPPGAYTSNDPDGADTTVLYASSSGSAGTFHQVDQQTYPNTIITATADLTGASAPSSSTFAVGASGILLSAAGGFVLRGDGTGTWPYLQQTNDVRYAGIAHNHDLVYSPKLTGVILPYGGSTAPSWGLLCQGQFVSASTYANLFAVIGHSFNGGVDPGNGTFKLPDGRDYGLVGASGTKALGSIGGSATATLPSHTHTISSDGAHTHTIAVTGNSTSAGGSTQARVNGVGGASPSGTGNTGSDGAHSHGGATGAPGTLPTFSTVDPYIAVNYVIVI